MKTHHKINLKMLLLIIVWIALQVLLSCSEEEIGASSVYFAESTQSIAEGSEAEVILRLDRTATTYYLLKITVETNAIYGEHFVTDPVIETNEFFIGVQKGQSSVAFRINTIDNELFDGGKFMIFRIMNTSTSPKAGEIASNTVTIADDEGPSIVDFGWGLLPIPEKQPDGLLIEFPFATPANGKGSVDITLTYDEEYSKRFKTDPEPIDNVITLTVSHGVPGISFTFWPIDDDIFNGNFTVTLSITSVSGVVQKGKVTILEITVHDNEVRSIVTFAKEEEAIQENETVGTVVRLSLSTPSAGTGTVSLSFSPVSDVETKTPIYGVDFVTIPEAINGTVVIPVTNGAKTLDLIIAPIHNSKCGDLIINLILTEATGSVAIVRNNPLEIIFKDVDASNLNFAKDTGLVDEGNPSGIEIHLTLSKPALENATIYVIGPSFIGDENLYGTVYKTEPAMIGEWYDLLVPLSVHQGATSLEFTVYPIDNAKDQADYILGFYFWYANNSCFVGYGTYALTIKDDD